MFRLLLPGAPGGFFDQLAGMQRGPPDPSVTVRQGDTIVVTLTACHDLYPFFPYRLSAQARL